MAIPRKELPGSAAPRPAGVEQRHRVAAHEWMRVTLMLRPQPLPESHPSAVKLKNWEDGPVHRRTRFSHRELSAIFEPRESHVARVIRFARAHGLHVVEVSRVRHDVVLAGPVGQLERAFGVQLHHYRHARGRYRAHEEHVQVPADLHEIVESIIGLDETHRYRAFAAPPASATRVYTPLELADHYNFPGQLNGEGQRIAILSFGGGYHNTDLDDYFRKLLKIPAPSVRTVSVLPGVGNSPLPRNVQRRIAEAYADPNTDMHGADGLARQLRHAIEDLETTQDIQIAGAVANGADIDVYFSRGDDQGFYYALYAALGLGGPMVQRREPPAAISISWGLSECAAHMKPASMMPIHRALEKARLMHVPVICASGDFGAYGSGPRICGCEMASVSFPASSPYALACGGTGFARGAGGTLQDVVWNAPNRGVRQSTGGGVSGYWRRPAYQERTKIPRNDGMDGKAWLDPAMSPSSEADFRGRGVPDVSAYADPAGGYRVLIGGVPVGGGGTSASTPLWAGLCARLRQHFGERLPWLNDVIYRPQLAGGFRSVVSGTNDLSDGRAARFTAHEGWNCCCGLGVPDGARLLASIEELCGDGECPA